MASHQTANFQLCQWEAEDEVLRTDFNSDNLKIENALSTIKTVADVAFTPENVPFAAGMYIGDGSAKRKIELGFTPRAVLVMQWNGIITSAGGYYGGLAVQGSNASIFEDGTEGWDGESTVVAVTEGGFWVGFYEMAYVSCRTNEEDKRYHYLALK